MTVMTREAAPGALASPACTGLEGRYRTLLEGPGGDSAKWLEEQLRRADELPDELPASPTALMQWSARKSAQVAKDFAAYLEDRHQGAPRRYFANRAQAIYFIQQVAPTKAVDGAWLYGTLRHWQDPRYHGLIRTYLEELGDGDPRCNHVLVYQRLLSHLGCLEPIPLDDERYLQGAIQLALGYNADEFLPEVIGYNLGYEQPPLHLLITTHELAELGIDAHYFRLHVTIDNAASGHAQKSVHALWQLCPDVDSDAFYRRVVRGFRLNDLGTDTPSLIAAFDLHGELVAALERKRGFGRYMHSDHCRLQGETINQWLATPGRMGDFLQALETQGWVRRHQDPTASRFWKVIDGPTAAMFGVFSPYEMQLWHDWIAGDWQAPPTRRLRPGSWEDSICGLSVEEPVSTSDDVDELIEAMAGNRHALPQGLQATQAYTQLTGLAYGRPS